MFEVYSWFISMSRGCRYLDVGRDIVASLQKSAKCRCGYCHIADVESHEQDDHMESFFLSETVGGSFFCNPLFFGQLKCSMLGYRIGFSNSLLHL